MTKKYLLTPGPTPVPPEVLLAGAEPIIHHRTSEFSSLFESVRNGLKNIYKTSNEVLIFASSGTGAMEASIVNLLSPEDKVLVLATGVFGNRWGKIMNAYGVSPIVHEEEWGAPVCLDKIEDILNKEKNIKAIFTTLTETSTGVVNDIQKLASMVKDKETILVVDAISGLGGQKLPVDEWNVDVVVAGSQKGLMIPPGLSFVSLNEKAWKAVEESKLPKFYWDLKKAKDTQQKNQTPFTPAVSLIANLSKAIELIEKEGIDNVWARHKKLADAVRKSIKSLGFELFSSSPCDVVTAVKMPDGIDGVKLVKDLRQEYGISIAGGQQKLKGKIFRIAHLGYMERFDMIIGIAAIEMMFKKLGHNLELGKGIAVVEEALLS